MDCVLKIIWKKNSIKVKPKNISNHIIKKIVNDGTHMFMIKSYLYEGPICYEKTHFFTVQSDNLCINIWRCL